MHTASSKFKGLIENIWPWKRGKAGAEGGSVADLMPEEQRFLELTRPLGLDWKATRADFRGRYGTGQYHDHNVVILPAATIFTDTPLQFHMYNDGRWSDLPPEYLFAHFTTYPDARSNFADAEAQMIKKLGEGERKDVSNCLIRNWRFGVFEVSLKCWPEDIQGEWMKKQAGNIPAKEAATITISSDLALIYPAKGLSWIADSLAGKNSETGRAAMLLDPKFQYLSRIPNIRRSRRNPAVLQGIVPDKRIVAWKEAQPGRIGVSYKETSLLFEMTPKGALVLLQIRPARGSGGSELILEEAPAADPRYPYDNRTGIILHGEVTGLDDLARTLCAFWSLPLKEEEGLDD